jgi:hypothetical protein
MQTKLNYNIYLFFTFLSINLGPIVNSQSDVLSRTSYFDSPIAIPSPPPTNLTIGSHSEFGVA